MAARLPEVAYTVDSLAEYLTVSKSYVYKLAASGRIRSYKLGKELRFSSDHVAEYLEACDKDRALAGEEPSLTVVGRSGGRARKQPRL